MTSPSPSPSSPHQPLDHQRLLAEIDEEVRRRRESGEIPADLERELDLVFARFAPVHALEADFEQVLTRAEQSSFIDTIAPVESSRPVVPIFKKVVRKIVAWYIRYIAHQATAFNHAITRAVRLLGERVDGLEQASPLAASKAAGTATAPAAPDLSYWNSLVIDHVRSARGRVVHAEAGDGSILRALKSAGVDAYGVDPFERPDADGLEVRDDEAVVHFKALPDGVLGGVVLSGCVDRLPLGALVQLADLVMVKTAPGASLVVISRDPRTWGREQSPLEVDLSPGRPLHAETWRHLLVERGFAEVEALAGPRPHGLTLLPDDHVLNENLERLNDLLFGPSSYAVVARKPA
jgi:hypothetical protein